MKKQVIQTVIVIGAAALSVAACTSVPNSVELSHGDAVRSNMQAQVYDPATIASPSSDAVEGTDGQRMEAVMETHRGQQGSAESVAEPIVINMGQ